MSTLRARAHQELVQQEQWLKWLQRHDCLGEEPWRWHSTVSFCKAHCDISRMLKKKHYSIPVAKEDINKMIQKGYIKF